MSTIFFMRHGQASFGKENYDALSRIGWEQSYLLGKYFVRRGIVFDSVYAGTLARHAETAHAIALAFREAEIAYPEAMQMDELNEYDSQSILKALVPELLEKSAIDDADVARIFTDRKSFQRVFEAVMLAWAGGAYRAEIPAWTTFVNNVQWAIDAIMQRDGRGKKIAVITSGGPISVAIRKALLLSDENTMRMTWQIKNASFTRFKCTAEAIMLESFNEVPHLEEAGGEMITYR